MLRELKKGEKVLVIASIRIDKHGFKIGELVTVANSQHTGYWCNDQWVCSREELLAIGDKVVRGPDWKWGNEGNNGIGTVTEFDPKTSSDQTVLVIWANGNRTWARMTPDHQDLRPMGESEREGISGMEVTAVIYDECSQYKPMQEDTMTREQRAVEAEGQALVIKEEIAQKEEKVSELNAKAANLRRFKTDKDANVALVIKAKNLDNKATPEEQAKAMLELSDKEITV